MANQTEELAADLMAFSLLRGVAVGPRYGLMARNVRLRKRFPVYGEQREWEFDLIGLVVGPGGVLRYVDVFEFKVGRAGKLLKQLRSCRDLGFFRHIYGVWGTPHRGEVARACEAEGFGTLAFEVRAGAPSIRCRTPRSCSHLTPVAPRSRDHLRATN